MKKNKVFTIVTDSEPAMQEVMQALEKKREGFGKMIEKAKEKIKSKNV